METRYKGLKAIISGKMTGTKQPKFNPVRRKRDSNGPHENETPENTVNETENIIEEDTNH